MIDTEGEATEYVDDHRGYWIRTKGAHKWLRKTLSYQTSNTSRRYFGKIGGTNVTIEENLNLQWASVVLGMALQEQEVKGKNNKILRRILLQRKAMRHLMSEEYPQAMEDGGAALRLCKNTNMDAIRDLLYNRAMSRENSW